VSYPVHKQTNQKTNRKTERSHYCSTLPEIITTDMVCKKCKLRLFYSAFYL